MRKATDDTRSSGHPFRSRILPVKVANLDASHWNVQSPLPVVDENVLSAVHRLDSDEHEPHVLSIRELLLALSI